MMSKTDLFNTKEAEALMWAASDIGDYAHCVISDPRHPVFLMREMGFTNNEIESAGLALEDIAEKRHLPVGSLSDLMKTALKLAVEKTSWINCYRTNEPTRGSPHHINEALATLRSLAAKFEEHGIEITHIPFE